jgi:hypothetical protein
MRRSLSVIVSALLALLCMAGAAQAIVVTDGGGIYGVAIESGARGAALPGGVSAVSWSGPCLDPALSQDLWYGGLPGHLPDQALCYHGGPIMHKNETFALTWDAPQPPPGPQRAYWAGTRLYVEQYLRDVADGSQSTTSPYAVTTQYTGAGGRAENQSLFGGGCIDYGNVGGSACEFGTPFGSGHDYPTGGCTPKGNSFVDVEVVDPNTLCLTDAQIRSELATMINQTGIIGRTTTGYTPVVTLLLPAGVEACLDAARNLCSTNSGLTPPPPDVSVNSTGGTLPAGNYRVVTTYATASGESFPSASQFVTTTSNASSITINSPPPVAGVTGWYAYISGVNGFSFYLQGGQNAIGSAKTVATLDTSGAAPTYPPAFCSYHSQVDVGGTKVAYIVQPWSAATGCDEPDVPPIKGHPTPAELSLDVGTRLVSSLSQSHIASIVNPNLQGWVAENGSEIDDNLGCAALPDQLDSVKVGPTAFFLQREFNNAGLIESDPFTYGGCAPNVIIQPNFVVPSSVNKGDVVQFDGSTTASTLIVPSGGYVWSFGDGKGATGPSVVHSYASPGSYTVTLTVTDRGGNVRSLSQVVVVNGAGGRPGGNRHGFKARIQLMPQGLRSVLKNGVALRVTANQRADAIATLSITRAAAKRAGIAARAGTVVIGRGTIRGITKGSEKIHLHLSRALVNRLRHVRHLTLTVRLSLFAAGGEHLAIDAAGKY